MVMVSDPIVSTSVRSQARAAGLRFLPSSACTQAHRDGVWAELRRALVRGTPISAQVIHVSKAGAFFKIDEGLVGFAAARELPAWLCRAPQAVHGYRTVRCVVTALSPDVYGDVFLSPRLATLYRTIEATSMPIEISGVVQWSCLAAVAVDLGGEPEADEDGDRAQARPLDELEQQQHAVLGFATASELPVEALRTPPAVGTIWTGYVKDLGTDVVLSAFDPDARARRGERQLQLLSDLRVGAFMHGEIARVADDRALVALADGLLWGVLAFEPEAPRSTILEARQFQVLGRSDTYRTGVHLELAQARRAR